MESQTGSHDRYQLRQKRQSRYKCGTCGLRECVCILAVKETREVLIGARGVPRVGQQADDSVHCIIVRSAKNLLRSRTNGQHFSRDNPEANCSAWSSKGNIYSIQGVDEQWQTPRVHTGDGNPSCSSQHCVRPVQC